MLQQVAIENEIDLELTDDAISLRSAKSHPRDSRGEAFAKAAEADYTPDNDLFNGTTNTFDQADWQW